MERDFLKKLGLDDDATDKVMAQYGKDIQSYKQNADKIKQLEETNQGLNDQLAASQKQLTNLKKSAGDNEELQAKLDKAIEDGKNQAKEFKAKMASQSKNFAIKNALRDAGAKNVKAVEALMDLDKVSFDDNGNLIGASDQIDAIKKSDDYLFEPDKPAQVEHKVNVSPTSNPAHADKSTIDLANSSYGEVLAFKQAHPDEYERIVSRTEGD